MSRATQDTASAPAAFGYGAVTLFGRPFHAVPLAAGLPTHAVLQPPALNCKHKAPFGALCSKLSTGFGLFRVRSPLLAKSLLFSSPPGTEMVHFPGFALPTLLNSGGSSQVFPGWVSPFGYPRIDACLRLPEAFRSLPRPSSPVCAKASTVCP